MKKKIMIVDDDKEVLEYISEVLTSNDYEVVTVSDSTTTLEMVEKTKPDVILLDLNMPNKSGFEITSELKYSLKYKNIPVIAISGSANNENTVSLMNICNIKICLEKPINPVDLIDKIRSL